MEENKKKNLMRQIIRFAFVGGSAFVIDYGVMIFLTEMIGINYLISSGISFSVSVIYNYILSVHWVFDVAEDRSKRAEFVIFIIPVKNLPDYFCFLWFRHQLLTVFPRSLVSLSTGCL